MTRAAGEVLRVQGLSFAYRSEPVLRGVSFAVQAGDFVALTGCNGAGKSTLLKIILGELAPDSGEVWLLGQPVQQFRDWPRIGYVQQSGTALAEGFPATASEVVQMGLYGQVGPLRIPRRRHRLAAREALALVDMQDHAQQRIGSLSGGQVQRVMIARALAGESRLLLLDEPAAGVDESSAIRLYELLQRLAQERGLAVLMVTHDIARAGGYVTRTLSLEQSGLTEL